MSKQGEGQSGGQSFLSTLLLSIEVATVWIATALWLATLLHLKNAPGLDLCLYGSGRPRRAGCGDFTLVAGGQSYLSTQRKQKTETRKRGNAETLKGAQSRIRFVSFLV
jgi:hypothetical protein